MKYWHQYYFNDLWLKFRYSSLLRLFFDALSKFGIRISPYYVVLEGLSHGDFSHYESGYDQYDLAFLEPGDIKEITKIPLKRYAKDKLEKRLQTGNRCLTLKQNGELAGFCWCDFKELRFLDFVIPLKEDEAYLFDMYILKPFRSRGLAPFIRYQVYKELDQLGKHTLYSYSDSFNTSSINFKKKLNAQFIELYLYLHLFNKWGFNFRLKKGPFFC